MIVCATVRKTAFLGDCLCVNEKSTCLGFHDCVSVGKTACLCECLCVNEIYKEGGWGLTFSSHKTTSIQAVRLPSSNNLLLYLEIPAG